MQIFGPWRQYWSWLPFAVGFVFLFPSIYLAATTPTDQSFTLPEPGRTMVIDVVKEGYRSLLGDHAFQLYYEVNVPADSSLDIHRYPPVQCSFQLVEANTGKQIAKIGELIHAYDHYSDETFGQKLVGFSSGPFELTERMTTVSITNVGCRPHSMVESGVGRISQFRDMLLVPIAASILQFMAFVSIAVGLAVGAVRYRRARLRTRRISQG